MYARVTRGTSKPGTADEATRIYQEEVLPAARQQRGFRSATFLVDRETNEYISVTQWASREELEESERNGFFREQVAKMMPLSATPPTRTIYEVALSTAQERAPYTG